MRFAVLVLAGISSICAQDSIQIVADENTVLVGRTLTLRVLVRDADGNPRPASPVTWTVNNSNLASITSTGELRPLTLGIVRVTARAGSLAAEIPIQALPREVRIIPASASLTLGATQQFRAEAVDANGAVMPSVTWTWQANNRNGLNTAAIAALAYVLADMPERIGDL